MLKEIPSEIEKELDRELPGTERKAEDLDYMGEGPLSPCTGKQRSFVYGLLNQVEESLGDYGIDDLKDLTIVEIGELIDELKDKRDEMNQNKKSSWGDKTSWSRW